MRRSSRKTAPPTLAPMIRPRLGVWCAGDCLEFGEDEGFEAAAATPIVVNADGLPVKERTFTFLSQSLLALSMQV